MFFKIQCTAFLCFAMGHVACYAIGPEQQYFLALASNGTETAIEYISDGEAWSDGNAIYGSKQQRAFSFCWATEAQLQCASKRGERPSVLYKLGSDGGSISKQANALFKKSSDANEGFFSYYVCQSGCERTLPKFIYLVTKAGC